MVKLKEQDKVKSADSAFIFCYRVWWVPWSLTWHLCLYICEKCEMSRLWHTNERTDGQWKVEQYSVWAESAIIVSIGFKIKGNYCISLLRRRSLKYCSRREVGGIRAPGRLQTWGSDMFWFFWQYLYRHLFNMRTTTKAAHNLISVYNLKHTFSSNK